MVHLNIGLNCVLEMTLYEAKSFIDVKLKAYNQLLVLLEEDCAKVKAHIKLVLNLLAQLNETKQKS